MQRRTLRSWEGPFPRFRGPWLGQRPPGLKPVEFAPQIFDTDKMSFGTIFSPDGTEFFFGYERPGNNEIHDIVCSRLEDGAWSDPQRLPVNCDVMDGDHCLSLDGTRLFWRSWRLLPGETEERDGSTLWWSERRSGEWSEAKLLRCGGEIRRTGYPAIGRTDTLYFPARGADGSASIFRAQRADATFTAPEEIVTGMAVGGDLCIAPDESYLIITCESEPENLGRGDLFVSFRRKDDTWTPLRHAGALVNTPGESAYTHCPAVTPDGAFLLYRLFDFETKRSRVFWVRTAFLDELRPR